MRETVRDQRGVGWERNKREGTRGMKRGDTHSHAGELIVCVFVCSHDFSVGTLQSRSLIGSVPAVHRLSDIHGEHRHSCITRRTAGEMKESCRGAEGISRGSVEGL